MPPKSPAYLGPYQRAVKQHGPGFISLLFGSREMQTRRFEVLAGCVKLAGRNLADLGCGHGDLLPWLRAQGVELGSYLGVEAMPEFVEQARARAYPGARFMHADFVTDEELFDRLVGEGVDTVMFCGSLNTLDEALALRVLDRAWRALSLCERGVLGFNFLAGGGHWPRPQTNLPRRPTRAWFDWALARTPELMFCQHYLGAHDATLVMTHGLV